ncbi:unnamed protein product [Euphydryas editha]|uniref:Methyltransferase domain-containing protein n=1 Tax=Euphydryas editha TaxID=104508 RepID=A0AAU9TV16_EUPED|nr:unnamed protein product [Euphydryas editha]
MDYASKLRQQLDSTIAYLTPLLSLANCHMVEFFTHNHWEKLLQSDLRQYLDSCNINDAVEQFWKCAKNENEDYNELTKWVLTCQSHYISINNEYCISTSQLQEKIKSWGGDIKHKVRIKEFMTSKKSYEVETMSHLVASLFGVTHSTHCVEAGGGRGHLPIALTLAYNLPSLTVDCDVQTINNAEKRVKIIQKQWHAIAKKIKDGSEECVSKSIESDLHRFAVTFITKDTDLSSIVREKFLKHSDDDDIKLLLTGLHTCGNLGPASLRIFSSQEAISSVLNVPCCYHLLHETLDDQLFDVFQRDQNNTGLEYGFPMSEHLRGYNLGRNARMLAAQSIDRVVYNQQLPDKSLLYRALLQVIIKTYLPDLPVSEGKLKGIGSKCKNFDEYFKMADSRLKLDLYGNLPESYLTNLGNLDHQWKKIALFYLIRLCLAQVIESVILLDRLLYLYENGFVNVYLVKLFDPILSPRCHGIVAVR